MIVLGITPGLRSLAYCVLFVRPGDEPELVDSDLLKGGTPDAGDTKDALAKKALPHALILDVVLERAWDKNKKRTVVMAIGPARPDTKEPPELVMIVRLILAGLAAEAEERGLQIEVISWQSQEELDAILGLSVKRAIRRQLNRNATTLIRAPYALAAGTALAAIKKVQELRLPGWE